MATYEELQRFIDQVAEVQKREFNCELNNLPEGEIAPLVRSAEALWPVVGRVVEYNPRWFAALAYAEDDQVQSMLLDHLDLAPPELEELEQFRLAMEVAGRRCHEQDQAFVRLEGGPHDGQTQILNRQRWEHDGRPVHVVHLALPDPNDLDQVAMYIILAEDPEVGRFDRLQRRPGR